MIPHGLEEEHFLQAADQIDKDGVPAERRSVHYDLVLRGKTYPPKYIISLAAIIASGVDHPSNRFNAVEAVNYFRSRDYQITDRRKQTAPLVVVSEDDDSAFPEGKEKYRIHRYVERNSKVANRAKENRIATTGKLQCEVCSFDFMEVYGEIGAGFIEAHHTVPVSTLQEETETKVSDIALVCSNCHRMLHRGQELLSVTKLAQILADNLSQRNPHK